MADRPTREQLTEIIGRIRMGAFIGPNGAKTEDRAYDDLKIALDALYGSAAAPPAVDGVTPTTDREASIARDAFYEGVLWAAELGREPSMWETTGVALTRYPSSSTQTDVGRTERSG